MEMKLKNLPFWQKLTKICVLSKLRKNLGKT